ncbi:alginate O-acetyltransferase AlgX-related protein [Loktanella sp. S4079]|uniref:alginate O-acetyltransferase AlgX-related protein n=1 Tax=Loktanella sp. S4079 TaxID=579483 RepID=UPI0006985F33|nr:hypothetical protein [Loktanella sp. S4079]
MLRYKSLEPLKRLVPAAVSLIALSTTGAYAENNFDCFGLATDRDLPTVEGKDGVFFRIKTDLRLNHPFSDQSIEHIAELSRALAENGTTLIFVPIPTKSVTMPDYLPPEAALYGFDLDIAIAVHDDILDRLNAAGVATVDAREAMLETEDGDLPFFRSDFHWSASGARETARAIGDLIQKLPAYADLDQTEFETTPLGVDIAFSGMRRQLQENCLKTLPEAETMTYETHAVETLDLGEGGLDLFGDEEITTQVALLGTSFSDNEVNNFDGFLAEYSNLEVVNYALTGGNQFGAMTSYLTSTEFQETRPRFLVWENPVYTNLAQYGDQPMRELIAAAGQTCTVPLEGQMDEDNQVISIDLTSYDLGPDDTIFLDIHRLAGTSANFLFHSNDGLKRNKTIERGERLSRTGRFYMPLSGLWADGAASVDISTSGPFSTQPSVFACTTQSKEEI